VATQGKAGNGAGAQRAIIGATNRIGDAEAVFVRTKDATGNEVDTAFHLVVAC